jgi:N-acetylglucosaminyl-diphospho-decaprenol L-rhamnosyltransferase
MESQRVAVVTVVVVTWNGAHLIQDCLASLAGQTLEAERFRVIVVDNASDDGTQAMLSRDFPWVDVISSPRNVGFAGGANLGLRQISTPYAVVLNNDATADEGMLASFVRALDDPTAAQVGAVTGRVVLAESGLLNSTGNLVSRIGRGFDRDWLRPDDSARPAGAVFGFCGAAACLRVAALARVGLFDEELFLYYEDTDLSWRLRAAGWEVRYEPAAVARHQHASSSSEGSPLFHFWNERNSLVVFTRHAPLQVVVVMLLRRIVGLAVHTVRDGPSAAVTRARWRAVGHYLRRLPRTLSERRSIWQGSPTSRSAVGRWLGHDSS